MKWRNGKGWSPTAATIIGLLALAGLIALMCSVPGSW